MAKIARACDARCDETTGNRWSLKLICEDKSEERLYFDSIEDLASAWNEIDTQLWGGRRQESFHQELTAAPRTSAQWRKLG